MVNSCPTSVLCVKGSGVSLCTVSDDEGKQSTYRRKKRLKCFQEGKMKCVKVFDSSLMWYWNVWSPWFWGARKQTGRQTYPIFSSLSKEGELCKGKSGKTDTNSHQDCGTVRENQYKFPKYNNIRPLSAFFFFSHKVTVAAMIRMDFREVYMSPLQKYP